jgi:transposase
MNLWDRIVATFKREAADVKEGLAKAGASLDAELERKQRELDAEPHERVDMILEDIQAADSRFEELEAKLRQTTDDPTDDSAADS